MILADGAQIDISLLNTYERVLNIFDGNNDLALFNFEKSYTKDSSSIETKKELALAYHKKKDYNNALKYYDFVLKTEPENTEILANKA